jgi:hypothetical protein
MTPADSERARTSIAIAIGIVRAHLDAIEVDVARATSDDRIGYQLAAVPQRLANATAQAICATEAITSRAMRAG